MEVLHLLGNRRDLDTYPSVYNAMYLLAEAGFFNVAALGSSDTTFDHLIGRRYAFGTGNIATRCNALANIPGHFNAIISYEPDDLIAYHFAPLKPSGRHFVHHSLEIPDLFSGRSLVSGLLEGLPAYRKHFGLLMRSMLTPLISNTSVGRAARAAVYAEALAGTSDLIVQDSLRLSLINHYRSSASFERIGLVPNCYIRKLEPEGVPPAWLGGLREDFANVITYIGGIEGWALDKKILEACAACDKTLFLFSGWSRDGYAKTLVALVKQKNWTNIRIDVSKKSDAELNAIVDASDAGLVYYASPSMNVMNTGLSSGKMHKFLGQGKPVIALNLPLMGSFIVDNHFGETFENTGIGLSGALSKVFSNIGKYREAIARDYPQLCSFETSYGKMIEGWRK